MKSSIAAALGGLAVAVVLAACSPASEGKPVKIPTFDTPTGSSAAPAPTETTTWEPTWSASIPTPVAPVVKPTTKTPKPPTVTPPPNTVTPGPTILPTDPGPGGPFAREGERCAPEGAVGITRSGRPVICAKGGRGDALRWRRI